MAIKKAKENEDKEIQTELVQESRDEKLARLLGIETEIQNLKVQKEKHKAAASGFEGQIKNLETKKLLLVNDLNVGQETIVVKEKEEAEASEGEDN